MRFMSLLTVALLTAVPASPRRTGAVTYERRELTIPMRDGVRLFAVALVPAGTTEALPILLVRTPFGAAREFKTAELPQSLRELGEDGYIFVTQDVRGRGASQGTFVTSRPLADPKDPRGVDESTDAWDTIDWLVKELPGNNGRVGLLGMSYRGWLAAIAAVHPHPALKAVSPQAPMSDTWLGDDFFHQGAFRQTQAVPYCAYVEGTGGLDIPDDEYAFYLRLGTLDAIGKATGVDTQPSWKGFRAHPARDEYWKARALQDVLKKTDVPMLFVGGFWDEEDILGPQIGYRTVEQQDRRGLNRIVMGPWAHRGWSMPGGDSLGPLRFGTPTADHFREQIQRPWFAHDLHDEGEGRFPEAWVFESGSNRWRTFDTWPPAAAVRRSLYLRENGALSFDPPDAAAPESASFDAYRADPARPVPHAPRPDDESASATWMLQDQRFVDGRPDVATWMSAPLGEDLTIAGDVTARLFASTSGSDADWVVKLIDVFPESGYQLMVSADILRGRYWKGFEKGVPIPPDTVVPFTVDLHQQLYRFLKGHRLMVQVQSSWFPLYDRNPQRFVANIFDAKPSDFRAAEHRIWRSRRYPSHVEVPVFP